MQENKLEPGKSRTAGCRKRMGGKTSMYLHPSISRRRSSTCAVTGCMNNEYNLEV